MKFKRITIKNIGSIESKTIDFTAEPLGSAPLFLISGPTGSGKSIILDAICLALYGKAVRLEKVSNRENYMDPQFNCSADGSITLSDARQLVRRGTTNALAEFVFEGNDGKEYTASWTATRGKKGSLNTRLTASRHIVSADKSVDCNKDSECNACIADPSVVGLKFDEYCRTTILTQGDFSKFLDSDTKEKANILEKVTGTEIFSKIGEKINDEFKKIQASAQNLLDDINDEEKQPMTEDVRNAVIDEGKELDEKRNGLVKGRAIASDKKSILDRKNANRENSANAEKKLKQAAEQKATDDYKSAVKTSADWKASIDARGALKSREDAKKAMENAQGSKNVLKDRFDALVGGLEWLKESLKAFEGLDGQIKEIEEAIEAAKESYAKLNPAELEKEGKRLGDEKNIFDQIINQVQIWLTGRRNIIDQNTISQFSPEQKAILDDASAKAAAFWAASDRTVETQKKYDEVFAGFQNHAAAVRSTLKKGETCPVCGSIVENVLSDETIEGILKPFKDDIDAARNAEEEAKNACSDIIEAVAAKSREKGQEISDWQARNAEATKVSGRITELTTQLGRLQAKMSTKNSIKDTINRITPVMNGVKGSLGTVVPTSPVIKENRNLEADWNNLRSEVDTNASNYRNAEAAWNTAKEDLAAYLAANPEFTDDYLVKLSSMSMKDIDELDRRVKTVNDMETAAKAQIEACKAEAEAIEKDVAEKKLVFGEEETSYTLQQSIASLDSEISVIDTRKGEIKHAIEVDDQKIKSMKDTREKYEKIRPTLTNYETLNSLFGQGGGTLFKKIAQSHLLGILLENANFYLSKFSDRYELMRQEGSLVVLMKDKQQDGAPRPANTLSGGESFMASLALALGLSSFNSNEFSSDTIFIDEGFGTLSPKCLEGVYETLMSLKDAIGKTVGIISHVEYLKDNIHPQIVVEPIGNGLSIIKDPE